MRVLKFRFVRSETDTRGLKPKALISNPKLEGLGFAGLGVEWFGVYCLP